MSVEIAWKQNILVTDFHLLKSLLVVLGFGSQAFVCGFSRQNINSVIPYTGLVDTLVTHAYMKGFGLASLIWSLPWLYASSVKNKKQALETQQLVLKYSLRILPHLGRKN